MGARGRGSARTPRAPAGAGFLTGPGSELRDRLEERRAETGNSVRAQRAIQRVVEQLGAHPYASTPR